MTLTQLFTQIADAIREKKGTTESIVAENFPEEIESIESGGKFILPEGTKFEYSTFTSIDFSNVDTSNITDMSEFFSNCTALRSINLNDIDISEVTEMTSMFGNCTSLISVNMNDLDVSNITKMNQMFQNCTALTTLDISNWDLSGLGSYRQNRSSMFSGCTNLSNDSLNSILKAFSTIDSTSSITLKYMGFTQTQAETCTTLSNWSTLSAKGWTTGY